MFSFSTSGLRTSTSEISPTGLNIEPPFRNALEGLSYAVEWIQVFRDADHIIDRSKPYRHAQKMTDGVKKVTANLPAELLESAQRASGLGITETLVAGLKELERSRKRSALRKLRGRVKFDLDLDSTRR